MRDRPRVLVITPDYPPEYGGINNLLHRVVADWQRVDARVVTFAAAGSDAFDRAQQHQVRRVGNESPRTRVRAVARLNRRAFAEGIRWRPDITLSGHIVAAPAAFAIARTVRSPFVQYLHAQEVLHRPTLATFAVSRAAATIVVSAFTRELAIAHGGDESRLRLIHPGIDLPPRPQPLPASERRADIVVVARLAERYKGHDVLLRALPLIVSRVPSARLVVVGDGPLLDHHRKLAAAFGVTAHVEFLGAISNEERDAVLARASVFAMPSRISAAGAGEGFGIVYLEASSHGLPVVAGDRGGAIDAVKHGETGLLVDGSDHVAVADAIARLLEDPVSAERLGEAGIEWSRNFEWAAVSARVEDLLLEVISR